MRQGACFLSFVLFVGAVFGADMKPGEPPRRDGPVPVDPVAVGRLVVDNFLNRTPRIYTHRDYTSGLHYAEVCTAVGALRLAEALNDAELIERVVQHYEGLLDEEEGNRFISRESHVDHNVMGSLPLEMFLATGDERFKTLGLSFADLQWAHPREDGLTDQTRWWIDDMYMVGMLQMQACRASGERIYADHAAAQIVAYNQKLQQPNGLYHHGPEHPFCWGRGNGWVAASMAEVLRTLPEDHPLYAEILSSYRTMMAALLTYQCPNGMWRQVVDYEYAWAEGSCTAMFAYAMTIGIKNGLLDRETYGPACDRAWQALCAHVDPEGNLREICVGTSRRDYLEYYLQRGRSLGDLHGQAPFLWLVAERIGMNP